MGMIPDIGVQRGPGIEPSDDYVVATHETNKTIYTVEVIRRVGNATEVFSGGPVVEVSRPGGTVVNIGAGPTLPETPYEGQVWILT